MRCCDGARCERCQADARHYAREREAAELAAAWDLIASSRRGRRAALAAKRRELRRAR